MKIPCKLILAFAVLLGAGVVIAQTSATKDPRIKASSPIKGFKLRTFTKDGFPDSVLRSSEAIVLNTTDYTLLDMALTLFSGDATERPATILLSPEATAFTEKKIVQGPQSVRLVHEAIEVSGEDWRYTYENKNQQRITISKNARVVFQGAALGDILK